MRLWDARAGSKIVKLRGHSDNVRALALSHDGTKALSGGSDGTVKLWDVGLQRCVQVRGRGGAAALCAGERERGGEGGLQRCVQVRGRGRGLGEGSVA